MSYLSELFKVDEDRLKHMVRMITDHFEKRLAEGEADLKKIAAELLNKPEDAPSAAAADPAP